MRSAGSRDKAEARKPLARLLIGRAAMAAAMVAIATVASFAHASAAERGKSAFDVAGALNIYFAQHPELRRDPRMALYPAWASGPFTAEAPLPAALLAAQPGQHATLRALHAAGGRIVAGTDLVIAPNLIGELTAYVAAGRSPFTALQSATAVPARALDLDAGTLEAGKLADIVLVEGDPRRDIGALFNVRHVIANGRAFSVADLLALGAASPVKPAVDDDR